MNVGARDEARQRYVGEFANLEAAAKLAETRLRRLVEEAGIPAVLIKARAKDVASFVKKLHRYGADCWARTTDKVGAQTVVQTLDEVRKLRALLEQGVPEMPYLYTTDKSGPGRDPRALSYAGVHVQVQLAGAVMTDGEPIECEVQLRTQAQDVWASLEHGVVYKPLIEPSTELTRKIERLSVLVEMFDEEVDEVLAVIKQDPRYELALLLRAAKGFFHTFMTEPGEDDLSFEVLEVLRGAFEDGERGAYDEQLGRFVAHHGPTIERLYSDYGRNPEFTVQFAYFLFTQPESLIVLERLMSKPMILAEAVSGTEIDVAVRHLADAWGRPLPEQQ